MKKELLQEAISHLDEDLIEQAMNMPKKQAKRRHYVWKKATIVAASIAVVGVSVWGITKHMVSTDIEKESVIETEDVSDGTIIQVTYPKAYSYEDFDTRMTVMESNPVKSSFLTSIQQFSYKSAASIFNDKGDNQLYSPLSLYYALSLAASGAKGTTQKELFDALGVSTNKELAEQAGNLYRLLYKENEYSTFRIANSLWMNQEISGEKQDYNNDFLNQAVQNYYASIYSVDFSNTSTSDKIGSWISENTNHTLGNQFTLDGANQLMSLINTIYLYDEWNTPFEKSETKQDTFYCSNNEKVSCDFMNQELSSGAYRIGNGFTASSLGLKNVGSMVFILPDEGVTVNELLSSPERIQEIFSGGKETYGKVTWKIPKFTYGASNSLKEDMEQLGVKEMFKETADFTGIKKDSLYVSNIKQDTHISIDEYGVEASACTEIDFPGSAMPDGTVEMILNRPFIYGIMSDEGLLSFIGVCNNPSKQ